MARIIGLEKKQAPLTLRWFYGIMRKMFGKDLTPAKVQMKYPPMVWGGKSDGSLSRTPPYGFDAIESVG